MGSYSDISINGYSIFSQKNDIFRWVFSESEKKIVKRRLDPDDDLEDAYLIESKVSTIIKRLELNGSTLESAKLSFENELNEILEYLEESIANYESEYNDDKKALYDFFASNKDFFKWQEALKIVIEKKLSISNPFNLTHEDFGDDLLNFILRPAPIWVDNFFPLELNFPIRTFDDYARVILSVCPEDSLVVLDATNVVEAGYSNEFEHLEALGGENSKFHLVAKESFNDLRSIIESLELIKVPVVLPRILYANAITIFETYLSDTMIYFVTKFDPLIRRFVEQDEDFSKEMIPVSDIFKVKDKLDGRVRNLIQQITYHNLKRVKTLYKNILGIDFPSMIERIEGKIFIRHDIVHRNGKNVKGRIHAIKMEDTTILISELEAILNELDIEVRKLYPEIIERISSK